MKEGIVPFTVFALLDAVYILIGTVSFSVFLYAVNNGGFRGYLLFGVLSGLTVYHYTVGRIVMLLSESIVRFIRLTVMIVLVRPVVFVIHTVRRFGCWVLRNTAGRVIHAVRYRISILYTDKVMRRIHKDIRFTDEARKGLAQSEKTK